MKKQYTIDGRIIVQKETYAILKSKKKISGAFATIDDGNELTIVIEESKIRKEDYYKINKDWKIITFDFVLPFNVVGFLAKISAVLAENGISIFVISSYSTDHILVKSKDLTKSLKILSDITIK